MAEKRRWRFRDYRIGLICALPTELAACQAMLDEEHTAPRNHPHHDHNTYTFGRIGEHDVVIACLPAGSTGVTSAAKVAQQMQYTFRNLRMCLMVGIGGGVPSKETDIRLGDVVVSLPTRTHGGVMQYDFGKTTQKGRFERTGALNKPPKVLLSAVANLQASHLRTGHSFMRHMSAAFTKYPKMAQTFARPNEQTDMLYEADYDHPKGNPDCSNCDVIRLIPRSPRAEQSVAHYGLIASGNQVMRHGVTRERLRQKDGALCFEMEAAGLMDDLPCLVIRGICDYADSHKNKPWQPFAAMAAACYAKELLSHIPGRLSRICALSIGRNNLVSSSEYVTYEPVRLLVVGLLGLSSAAIPLMQAHWALAILPSLGAGQATGIAKFH